MEVDPVPLVAVEFGIRCGSVDDAAQTTKAGSASAVTWYVGLEQGKWIDIMFDFFCKWR